MLYFICFILITQQAYQYVSLYLNNYHVFQHIKIKCDENIYFVNDVFTRIHFIL